MRKVLGEFAAWNNPALRAGVTPPRLPTPPKPSQPTRPSPLEISVLRPTTPHSASYTEWLHRRLRVGGPQERCYTLDIAPRILQHAEIFAPWATRFTRLDPSIQLHCFGVDHDELHLALHDALRPYYLSAADNFIHAVVHSLQMTPDAYRHPQSWRTDDLAWAWHRLPTQLTHYILGSLGETPETTRIVEAVHKQFAASCPSNIPDPGARYSMGAIDLVLGTAVSTYQRQTRSGEKLFSIDKLALDTERAAFALLSARNGSVTPAQHRAKKLELIHELMFHASDVPNDLQGYEAMIANIRESHTTVRADRFIAHAQRYLPDQSFVRPDLISELRRRQRDVDLAFTLHEPGRGPGRVSNEDRARMHL